MRVMMDLRVVGMPAGRPVHVAQVKDGGRMRSRRPRSAALLFILGSVVSFGCATKPAPPPQAAARVAPIAVPEAQAAATQPTEVASTQPATAPDAEILA